MDEIKMPCGHGYRSPAEYSDHFFDQCINVFGRTSEEILLALTCYDDIKYMKQEQTMSGGCVCRKHSIKFYNQNYCDYCKQEQSKMTRDEAGKKVCAVPGYDERFIYALEALGLLKFDEPEMVEWCCEGIVHRYPKDYDPNHSSGLIWTKVVKPPICWRNSYGNECYFRDSFDPNTNAAKIVWTKVTKPQSEFLTIPVGSHTHDIALETIVKALKAKGLRVFGPEHGKEL